MSAAAIIQRCIGLNIRLLPKDGELGVNGPKAALTPDLLALLKEHKPDLLAALAQPPSLDAILVEACQGVEGIEAATFRAPLSPEDVKDIKGGHIPGGDAQRLCTALCRGHTVRPDHGACCCHSQTGGHRERVRCNGCQHSERDTIGDGSGIGRCKIGGEGTGPRYPALWANTERECKDFEARENHE